MCEEFTNVQQFMENEIILRIRKLDDILRPQKSLIAQLDFDQQYEYIKRELTEWSSLMIKVCFEEKFDVNSICSIDRSIKTLTTVNQPLSSFTEELFFKITESYVYTYSRTPFPMQWIYWFWYDKKNHWIRVKGVENIQQIKRSLYSFYQFSNQQFSDAAQIDTLVKANEIQYTAEGYLDVVKTFSSYCKDKKEIDVLTFIASSIFNKSLSSNELNNNLEPHSFTLSKPVQKLFKRQGVSFLHCLIDTDNRKNLCVSFITYKEYTQTLNVSNEVIDL